MNSSIRFGSLFGIPFYINPSWFFVLALVTWTYGNGLGMQFPALPGGVSLGLGLATALLLFASVLAHELGHSVVALRQGIKVQSITLFLFGGLASLEQESKTPADAFWVAIAGPLVSLILCGLLTVVHLGAGITGPVAAILGVLASVNLALALFNLIPGLPLDGGNILKALVWKITGNPYKGVAFASKVGQAFGWLAIASGLLPLILSGSFGNFWNLLIGWFLLQNASRSAQYASLQQKMDGLTAAAAVTPNSPIVPAQTTLRDFADQRILNPDSWQKFLVTDKSGQLVGEFKLEDMRLISSDRWSEVLILNVMQPVDMTQIVSADQPLLEVVKLLETKQLSALPVVQDNGVLLGILEKPSILKLLQSRAQPNPA